MKPLIVAAQKCGDTLTLPNWFFPFDGQCVQMGTARAANSDNMENNPPSYPNSKKHGDMVKSDQLSLVCDS